jgi:DNA primase
LFNYSTDQRDIVYLVEGAMDVIALWEVGIHAYGIYGSRLSEAQCNLIMKNAPERVVLLFDQDPAGKACAERSAALLMALGLDVTVAWWDDYKDVAEMPLEYRKSLLDMVTNEM